MSEKITITLPEQINDKLETYTQKQNTRKSIVVCDALSEYFARKEFHRLRSILVPEAEEKGLYTDKDIFEKVS